MGLCFGERQRLKGEAHTPRGDALFAPVQRIEKGKSGESKSFGVRTRKDLFSQEEMEQPHLKHHTSTTDEDTTDDFCLHTLHTPLHHIGYFFDVQDCCL